MRRLTLLLAGATLVAPLGALPLVAAAHADEEPPPEECVEDGIDQLHETPLWGAASESIHVSEPFVRDTLGDEAADGLHDANCTYVVPLEHEIEDGLSA